MSGATASATTGNKDIMAEEGKKIIAAALRWFGTPYALIGPNSTKGKHGGADCSGSTWHIYEEAGFPYYPYQWTPTFLAYVKESGRFREVDPEKPMQDGDILYWSGHMAIYSTFTGLDAKWAYYSHKDETKPQSIRNDMWTATNPKGRVPYGPAVIKWWRHDAPKVFRYQNQNLTT